MDACLLVCVGGQLCLDCFKCLRNCMGISSLARDNWVRTQPPCSVRLAALTLQKPQERPREDQMPPPKEGERGAEGPECREARAALPLALGPRPAHASGPTSGPAAGISAGGPGGSLFPRLRAPSCPLTRGILFYKRGGCSSSWVSSRKTSLSPSRGPPLREGGQLGREERKFNLEFLVETRYNNEIDREKSAA